jgi:hypothetical protein
LRDVANFAFKQFCTEITVSSLNNLLEIVQTPNIEANKMLFDEEEEGEGMEIDERQASGVEHGEEDEEGEDEEDEDSE